MNSRKVLLALSMLTLFSSLGLSQVSTDISALIKDSRVEMTLERIEKVEPELVEEQIKFSLIPAPSFQEGERGKYFAARFKELGLENVRIDEVGNVIAERPGTDSKAPTLLLAAHLDTVFPIETELKPIREGNVIKLPGISDDGRGLAVLIAIAHALNETGLKTKGKIIFTANVGEEGAGDLRGVRYLFNHELKGQVSQFISIDGSGLDVVTGAVGSKRYRVYYKGPGGHSYGAFGMANPIHALGRLISKVAEFQTPVDPKTTFNVGIVKGGTSVNSIAFEASADVDLRSIDPWELEKLDKLFKEKAAEALSEENRRWMDKGKLEMVLEKIGDRPTGNQTQGLPIIRLASSVNRALNIKDDFGFSSTDANLPISLGIPAITIGGGGTSTGAHSLREQWDSTDSAVGSKRALLLVLGIVGVED
ncbi:MAG: M20/M25/M40 family metallo-hydrolase [Pyrinomonadaceae bacterium]